VPPPRDEDFRPYPTVRPAGTACGCASCRRSTRRADFGGPRPVNARAGERVRRRRARGPRHHQVARHRPHRPGGGGVGAPPAARLRRRCPELAAVEAKQHVFDMAEVYHEVCRLHAHRPVDVVMAPALAVRGAGLLVRPTAFPPPSPHHRHEGGVHPGRVGAGVGRAAAARAVRGGVGEGGPSTCTRSATPSASGRWPITRADPGKAFISPLGMRDAAGSTPASGPSTARLRGLYVGRLEQRKGADVFLEAAARLAPEFPERRVRVGREGTAHRPGGHAPPAVRGAVRRRPALRARGDVHRDG